MVYRLKRHYCTGSQKGFGSNSISIKFIPGVDVCLGGDSRPDRDSSGESPGEDLKYVHC